MRTTLKRGIGRGASVGNGSGNGHAVFPPSARTAMRRYVVPPPPTRTGWQTVGWFFRWLLIAVAIVASGLAGGAYLYTHQTLSAFTVHTKAGKAAAKHLQTVASASQPAIAILIGYDKRAGHDPLAAGSRSDTIMLVRADPEKHAVSLLSFPRDLVVPIYCDHGPTGVTDRINEAWSRCGAAGTVATVEALTGVRPNYLATVDFHGFKLLVNKLHGVYMDVDHRYLNTQGGPYGYAKIDLQPGYQRLDGEQALDYVRFRHTDSDLYRLARQQAFVTALRERMAGGSIFDVFKIIGALKGNLEIGQGGGGTISPSTALSYLQFAHGLPSGHFFRDPIENLQPYGPSGAELWAPQSAIQAAVQQFLNPDVEAPSKANAAALGIKRRVPKPALKPSQISTLVLNGTTVPGLAANTSYSLAKAGYHTVALANGQAPNAPSQAYFQTQIYYAPGQPHAQVSAKELQKLFPNSVVGPVPPEIASYEQNGGNPQTVVVLGSSFDGHLRLAPPPPPDTTPKHAPPQVTTNPGATLSLLRGVRHRLPFPVMVPHVLESHSGLAQLEPLRVYRLGHQPALRLTFVLENTGMDYWGIEETDWTGAPALASPSISHVFHGRHYDFYFTGAHLHMVVLNTPKARYWVVNSLLDKLSNETMIAIAKGLKPLGS
jgi:LCP family protein required for cell wall assembly